METPVVNVNLQDCYSYCQAASYPPRQHETHCPAYPVLVPLPLDPWRSVTMTVVLGECRCFDAGNEPLHGGHWSDCPARPIRVTCSIGGKDWASSEVTACEPHPESIARFAVINDAYALAYRACRARWALVKTLLSGMSLNEWSVTRNTQRIIDLWNQRDAVFAALVKMRMAEDALIEALGDYEEAMRGEPVGIYGLRRESLGALERYVYRVIEQVMAIIGGF